MGQVLLWQVDPQTGRFEADCFKEKTEMKANKQFPSRWFYGVAVLVIFFGTLISAWILKGSGIGMYPTMIADAYREEQYHLSVPGSKDVKLTRTGAYGIYYRYNLVTSTDYLKMPPAINCSLTSKSSGAEMKAVPDYVETNRYWSKDQGGIGVLIMSITVNEPDTYTFACHYQDGSTEPEIAVALGPNYFWEFLKVVGKISLSLFGAMTTLCGSILIGLSIAVIVAVKNGIRHNSET